MARILFALPRFHTNLWFAARAMKAAGHELEFLVNIKGVGEEYSALTPTELGTYPKTSEVAQVFDAFQPDLAIIRNAWALSRHASKIARSRNVPTLLYNLLPASAPTTWTRRMEQRIKRLPIHRITPSRGLPGSGPVEPYATWLPWPVEALPVTDPLPRAPGKVALLCVGKLGVPRKRQIELVELIETAGLQDHLHLTLVGSTPAAGEENSHYAQMLEIAQKPWVTMAEDVPFLEMPRYFAAADICVLPSSGEPLGAAPVEAMAYGAIPLISSESGSAGHLDPTKDGYIIDMAAPDSVIRTLRTLCTDDALRARRAEAVRAKAQAELSEARFVTNLSDILARFGLS